MSDLTLNEQKYVRTALRYLHNRIGTWAAVARGLRIAPKTLDGMLYEREVTAGLALRVARLLGVSMDSLLAGQVLPDACPHCGHLPDPAESPPHAESPLLASPQASNI